MATTTAISFQHEYAGTLVIDNGLDDAQWGYNLNTVTFPTYGGEVVQVLSVYIDDLTLMGTCATYKQIEAIYGYFATYFQSATQGKQPNNIAGDVANGGSYNRYPVFFSYPHRNWYFKIFPKMVPGFHIGREVVTPTWQLTAHVVDDSPDLALIKDGIKAIATQGKLPDGGTLSINGEISPTQGNPDTDPFQTYTAGIAQQQATIQKYSDYYNSLLPAYAQGDFSALTGGIGATPSFGVAGNPGNGTATIPNPKNPPSNANTTGH